MLAALLIIALCTVALLGPGFGAEKTVGRDYCRVAGKPSPFPTLPKQFTLRRTYDLRYKDYLIQHKRYSHPDEETDLSNLLIVHKPTCSLLYYELGYPPPYGLAPMMIFRQKKGPTLLLVHATIDNKDRNGTLLRTYQIEEPYNQASIRIGGGTSYNIRDLVGDFDGDGLLEVFNLELKVADTRQNASMSADFGVASVYRYVPGGGTEDEYYTSPASGFTRVKGQAFQNYFMQHAKHLIDKDYPDYLARTKHAEDRDPLEQQQDKELVEIIVLNWLATVESTQSPDLIQEALRRLTKLPYPDKQRKEELVRMLIHDGYPMLKQ